MKHKVRVQGKHLIQKNYINTKEKNVQKDNGAVIIEAAVSLPIFMFLIFSILFTINMSIVQCRMQIALNETAKEISQYSYFYSLTRLNNLSAINADAAADTKKQVSDVVSGITTVYGSFENIVTDVGDAKDDISQKIEDIDLKGIENTVDTLKGQVSSEANTLSDGAQQTINTLKEAFKDPKALMLGLARIGANELDETVKSHLVAMMTQMLIKKNLADISNADDAYIDAYLRHLGVVGGFEGIDFTKSLYLKDGSDDIILVADYKVRLIRLFEHDIEFHFVQRAVTKAWMAGGLAEKETTGTTVVTGDKLSDLTGDALRAKIVEEYGEGAVLEVEKAYPGETGNWKYDDWRYHMYLYAASDPTEGASEGTTEAGEETETPAVIVVNPYDLTGGELRKYVSEEYGEGAVLEVEKAYPGETGNWGYDDWQYYMYLYAASDPTEGMDEGETERGRTTVDDLLKKLNETTNGKGVARNFESTGGYDQTLKDFYALNPLNVRDIQTKYGPGKVGTLSDGTKIVARQGSTTGGPTLEIKVSNSKVYKIRY